MAGPFHEQTAAEWEGIGRSLLRDSASERDGTGVFPLAVWRELASNGLFALSPGLRDSAKHHELISSSLYGLAKGSLDLPYCASVAAHVAIAADLLQTFGTEEQRKRYGKEFASGAMIGAICNAEEGAGTDLKLIKSRAFEEPGGKIKIQSFKPCATNLSIASLAFVSCFTEQKDIRVFLLEGTEFDQGPLQGSLASFRTGAVGFLKADNVIINAEEREIPKGLYALRHCFHTERYYLGVLVAGTLAGLEAEIVSRMLARGNVQQRQYLQDKLVTLRSTRVKIEALLAHVLSLTEGGRKWEKAAVELCVLKMYLNTDAPKAAQAAFECVGFEAVLQSQSAQRIARDLQALSYFGGTTELQKLQIFQDLAKAEADRLKKIA